MPLLKGMLTQLIISNNNNLVWFLPKTMKEPVKNADGAIAQHYEGYRHTNNSKY